MICVPIHRTKMDVQYYDMINQRCYEHVVPNYPRSFPYLIFVNSAILLITSNIWFKFPGTRSKIKEFITVLDMCLASPWTTKDLSRMVPGTNVSILNKQEREEVKALFERMKNFRLHTEAKSILYYTYMMQAILRLLQTTTFFSYVAYRTPAMKFKYYCVEPLNNLGYMEFSCVFRLRGMFTMLSIVYLLVLFVYTLICLYTVYWIFCFKLQEYSFRIFWKESRIKDIPNMINDFAFLLHLIDQYDQLFAWNFAVFLSEALLNQLNISIYWTQEKLRQRLIINSEGKTELQLPVLPDIPEQLFQLAEIEVLKFAYIKGATLISDATNLRMLKELWITNCDIKVEKQALDFLKKNLHILRVNFSNPDEIPSWLYNLSSLQVLYINDHFYLDKKAIVTVQSFKKLTKLKLLFLKLHTSSVPSEIIPLAHTLESLTIHNNDFKLSSASVLKKLTHLKELRLNHCQLDFIPSCIFSLVKLQEVDFSNNNLSLLVDLSSLMQLKNLVSLNLSYNNISSIPQRIARVSSLKKLYMNHNQLTSISVAVFKLAKLSCLDVSNNEIRFLPPEIGKLVELEYLSISHNKLTYLPDQLFSCTKLQTLMLSHNNISVISSLVGELTQLTYLDLVENQLEKLPKELEKCTYLKKLLVEKEIFDTLPCEVRATMIIENSSTLQLDFSCKD